MEGALLWDEDHKEQYFKAVCDAGFDHVRLPLQFGGRKEDETNLTEEYFQAVEGLIEISLRHGLIPVVDMHGYQGINKDPYRFKSDFLHAWEVVADRFKDCDGRVLFEVLNEPSEELTADIWNEFLNEALPIIRKSNPDRTLVVGTACCNTIENLQNLVIPEDDRNLLITVHDYTPMEFTHQGANWCDPPFPKNIAWTGSPEEKQVLIDHLDLAAAWAKEHDRKLWLGEFGAFGEGEMTCRCNWTSFMVQLCEERDIAWCYWEFYYGFGAYDVANDCWQQPLLNALISK